MAVLLRNVCTSQLFRAPNGTGDRWQGWAVLSVVLPQSKVLYSRLHKSLNTSIFFASSRANFPIAKQIMIKYIQSTFSQCITPVPNFFYALWHSMQDEMCHKAWLSVTSAKNVTLQKSLGKTGKYCVFTWYQHSWERDYYWKKNWEEFVWLSSLEQCGAVPISRNLEAFAHTSDPQFWTRVCR